MEEQILSLKVIIAQLQTTVLELTERIKLLEDKESTSGIYIDGVSDGFRNELTRLLGRGE